MYHFQILKKYTAALLNEFSNISVPVFNKEGIIIKDHKVPILFGNRDKAYSLENSNENLKDGNNYTIPRMALSFNSLTKAGQRDTSKYSKINLPSKTDRKRSVEFQFNSVAYDFQYTLHIATRNLSEMMYIVESIAPRFRPTYTIPVYEVDIQDSPTSITIELSSIDIDLPEELDEEELRIVRCQIPLNLRGNIYLPIQDHATIMKMKLYLNDDIEKDLQKSLALYQFETDEWGRTSEKYTENEEEIEESRENIDE